MLQMNIDFNLLQNVSSICYGFMIKYLKIKLLEKINVSEKLNSLNNTVLKACYS